MPDRFQPVREWLGEWFGKVGLAFAIFLAGWLVSGWLPLLLGAVATGTWLVIRIWRKLWRISVWRLRNRLLVTYTFIAVVPTLLIAGLVALAGYALVAQVAMNEVTEALDRRAEELALLAASIADLDPGQRPQAMADIAEPYFSGRFPGVEIVLRQNGREFRYPSDSRGPAPEGVWADAQGVLRRDDAFFLWRHQEVEDGDITVTAPLTQALLDQLAPQLGRVEVTTSAEEFQRLREQGITSSQSPLPPAFNNFDSRFVWLATQQASSWSKPSEPAPFLIAVETRVSAALGTLFYRQADIFQGLLLALMVAGVIVLAIVELVCWAIGMTMTRTITGAMHRLYEGTQRVMQGDFAHRIEVSGKDQLAELSVSFNRMTEHVQQLLTVAKEKERLQSEIEIAREVQDRLYPRDKPASKSLRLTAVCHPARMVSGDYYDYELLHEEQLAVAIGDVAGKGISAALLMATVQSSLRTQLQHSLEAARNGGSPAALELSTSVLVSRLNKHLCASTEVSKYATFCLGLYDELTGRFLYTNAGHLPPVLLREGRIQRLEVNGTVVGAFPFAVYDESVVELKAGDLLVGFTDGITEPENEFGEMFGEERLFDLLTRHAERDESRIIEIVLDSVRDWTGSDELQDDMTLLLARRL